MSMSENHVANTLPALFVGSVQHLETQPSTKHQL